MNGLEDANNRSHLLAPASDGASLAYAGTGAGIAVIAPLCFGTTLAGVACASGQQSFLTALGTGHELIAYDQRGAGASGTGAAAETWEQQGADLWSVADAAGVERAVLYGVFDAGFTIAAAAKQQPDRVLGLIFNLTPPAIGAADPREGVPDALAETWFGHSGLSCGERSLAVLQAIGIGRTDATALAEGWEANIGEEALERDLRLLRHADLRPLAPLLSSRALVIEPQRRPLIAGWGESLARLLPRGRAIRPTGAGEMLGGIHGFLALVDIDEGHYASRLAPAFSAAVGATEHSVGALRRIVVPVVDTVSSERAAEMACRLGGPQQAEIVLIHVVEVPLTRALSDASDAERSRGEQALQLGQAIVGHHGMRSRARLLFERSASRGIVRVAGEERADVIVMAMSEKRQPDPMQVSQTMRDVLRQAPCEVLIDQAQAVRA